MNKKRHYFLVELRRGLRDLGYIEGQNIKLVNTYAAEQHDRFAAKAVSLAGQSIDVIVALRGRLIPRDRP
jgi:putative ABC transport system substrate-binding protein